MTLEEWSEYTCPNQFERTAALENSQVLSVNLYDFSIRTAGGKEEV